LCYVYPPVSVIRNGGFYLYYLLFIYTYFIILGFSFAIGLLEKSNKKDAVLKVTNIALAVLMVASLVRIATGRHVVHHTRRMSTSDFSHVAEVFNHIDTRNFAIMKTAYYLLEPILYKQNTALEMLAAPPPGFEPKAFAYYREWNKLAIKDKRQAGYGFRTFFWTNNYYTIYRWGEKDIDVFKALMGVGRKTIDFKERVLVLNDGGVGRLASEIGGKALYALLDKAVILDREPSRDHVTVISPYARLNDDDGVDFDYDVVSYKPDKIRLQVTNGKPGILLFRDGYHKDWRAAVDGRRTEIFRANVGFKGVYLPPGRHQVTFRYLPAFYLVGFYSFITLSFAFPLLILLFRRF
jgi:hypothetical protein